MTTHTAELPPRPRSGVWVAHACEEELQLSRPPEAIFLPGGHSRDTVLDREPALPIDLDDDHVADLRVARHGGFSSVAATSYGPRPQDKLVNEDFALSAVLHSSDAEDVPRWSFAAVADGVSNETFYSARTARLACLVAFKTCRRMTRYRSGCGDDDALEALAQALASDLREAFRADRDRLIRDRCTPAGWDPAVFREHAGDDRRWYASTLLVAALGAESGFLLWCGDGGIEVVKSDREGGPTQVARVLQSAPGGGIERSVGFGVESSSFEVARCTYEPRHLRVDIFLASDGVDRTLARREVTEAGASAYAALHLDTAEDALAQLQRLYQAQPFESDNYSVARASLDLASPVATPPPLEAPPLLEAPPEVRARRRVPIVTWLLLASACVVALFLPGNRAETGVQDSEVAPRHPRRGGESTVRRERRGLSDAPKRPVVVALAPPALVPVPAPAPEEEEEPLPALVIDDDTKQEFKQAIFNAARVSAWVRHLQDHAGHPHTVVAYADRDDPESLKDCHDNAITSQRRAAIATSALQFALGPAAKTLTPDGRQRVCDVPPGVPHIGHRSARRLVLIEGVVDDCRCDGGR